MSKKVSIIVPVYNGEKYINKCLNSLLRQSYNNYEIILVNDGSKDNSKQLMTNYQIKYPNIKLINQENKGVVEAKKNGLKNISSDSSYFAFCDVDDYYSKDYLKIMVDEIEKEKADIVQCFYSSFIGFIKYNTFIPPCLKERMVYEESQILDELYISYFGITDFPGYLCTKLFDVKFAKIICELPKIVDFMADDLSVNIRLLPLCKKIVTIPDKLYYYRIGGGTSKYMPTFMKDYYSYHTLQKDMIIKLSLEDKYKHYSSIEIINVLHSWLIMNYLEGKTEEFIKSEFEKYISMPNIKDSINYLKKSNKWEDVFFLYLINNQFQNIYQLISKEAKKTKIKRMTKKVLLFLFN